MNGLVKVLLAALGLGAIVVIAKSGSSDKGSKYRIKYLAGSSPTEKTEFYKTKEEADSAFKKHIKTDSYISIEKRIGTSDKWESVGFDKGLGKDF